MFLSNVLTVLIFHLFALYLGFEVNRTEMKFRALIFHIKIVSSFNRLDQDFIMQKWFLETRKLFKIYLLFSNKNKQFSMKSCEKLPIITLNLLWFGKRGQVNISVALYTNKIIAVAVKIK